MSEPQDINDRPDGRHESLLSHILPESFPIPPSFLATSPIIREILTRDIAECSSESDSEDHNDPPLLSDSDSTAQVSHRAVDAKLAFHPSGVSYGLGYSAVSIQGFDRPVPNPHEVEESLRAEVELLRDNDIIPQKTSSESWQRRRSLADRVYRHVFSTRTKDHDDPVTFTNVSYETTPLLAAPRSAPDEDEVPTPPAEIVHERFEEAVAAQCVRTTWQREARTLIKYSAPLIATFLLHYSVTIGSVLTVGRLGMVELAAVNRKHIQIPFNTEPPTRHRNADL